AHDLAHRIESLAHEPLMRRRVPAGLLDPGARRFRENPGQGAAEQVLGNAVSYLELRRNSEHELDDSIVEKRIVMDEATGRALAILCAQTTQGRLPHEVLIATVQQVTGKGAVHR